MTASITLLDRLIGFPTVSHQSNMDMIDFMRDTLAASGIASQIIKDDTGLKANLYATVGPQDLPGVMLSGHTDVVPVAGQAWNRDPFKMSEADNLLYGRGTTDMKGFIACALSAAIRASDMDLKTPLHLAFSYDEEIGCVGVRRLIDVLENAPVRPKFCLIGEPTLMQVATAHKGKVASRAICRGVECHSAMAPTGVNAIHLAADLMGEIRKIQTEIEKSGARDGDYDVPYTTLHAGIIRGGEALNIVPNLCTLDFEIRNLAADDPEALMDQIVAHARRIAESYQGAAIEFEDIHRYPGLDTPPDSDVVSFVKSLTGANSTTKLSFGTEGGLFDQKLGVPTVVCGPGSMAQGHKPDEFIATSEMANCDRMLDALLDRLTD